MTRLTGRRIVRFGCALACLTATVTLITVGMARPATADSFAPVQGGGSTWSQIAISQWIVDLQNKLSVTYGGGGSSVGRRNFIEGTVDFAASDIPFQFNPEDGSAPEKPTPGSYAYMPITAGGTVFMYNLKINGQRVTNLRLSGTNVAKIFTGVIANWSDPALAADNPGLTLPNRSIVPVVRSDGSGSTAQLSMWLVSQHDDIWKAYCARTGRSAICGSTSLYPTQGVPGMVAQNGDLGVASYVSQDFADGAIGYVNYAYALGVQFPVAKLLNNSGYYTEPTPNNVAVSLLNAKINTDQSSADYLTQQLDGVYTDQDPRTYELSSYSYLILPTQVQGSFDTKKGKTLSTFAFYAMCEGQQESASLGYSPMPINLVQASFDQIKKIPGAVAQTVSIQQCNNPTFSPDGTNKLATDAPQPLACDHQGPTQCTNGTGGSHSATTPSKATPTAATTPSGTRAPGGQTATTIGGGATATTIAGSSSGVDASCAASGTCTGVNDPGPVALGSTGPAAPSPLTLAASAGWTSTQTLMVLVGLLTLALVLAPGFASLLLARKRQE